MKITCKYWKTGTGQTTQDGKIVPDSGTLLGWVVMNVNDKGYPQSSDWVIMPEQAAKELAK